LQVIRYLAADALGVAPVIQLSTSAGIATQIEQRGRMRLTANATDDVQVRNVEFFVDSVRVASRRQLSVRTSSPRAYADRRQNQSYRARPCD
jgi:hypothetical protein